MAAKKVAVVADPYTVYALRLLGVVGLPASDPREAAQRLRDAAVREDIGLVLLSSEYYDDVEEEVRRVIQERPDLIVARLPTVREPGQPMNVQKELLKALGMG